jgi:hypothetical protein
MYALFVLQGLCFSRYVSDDVNVESDERFLTESNSRMKGKPLFSRICFQYLTILIKVGERTQKLYFGIINEEKYYVFVFVFWETDNWTSFSG